jgi:hypothetical protein
MRRRAFGFALAAVLVSAACETGGTSAGPSATPAPAGDGKPVAVWREADGLVPAGFAAIRPPRLVVYGDGQVIVNATRTLRLPPAELTDLITVLGHDLAGQSPGRHSATDMPSTVFGVRTGDGPLREVWIPGIPQIKAGYPQPLYDAWERLTRLAGRVTASGQPYTSARVRLVAEDRRPDVTEPVQPWPAGVLEPRPESKSPVRVQDLSAGTARTVVKMVPRQPEQSMHWPVFRAPSGTTLTLSWRYLVPGEAD